VKYAVITIVCAIILIPFRPAGEVPLILERKLNSLQLLYILIKVHVVTFQKGLQLDLVILFSYERAALQCHTQLYLSPTLLSYATFRLEPCGLLANLCLSLHNVLYSAAPVLVNGSHSTNGILPAGESMNP
jgi:hypothetical protein